jgi:catechol 2,3-dioxygenase-like lactoylglutathione lyase family enzyme
VEIQNMTLLIQVFDMSTSLAFYRDLLGFEVVASSGDGDDFDWGLLRLGPADLMLNCTYETGERPAKPDPFRRAIHRDTGLFFYCADVDAAYFSLAGRGLAVSPPTTRDYGMRQFYLEDPDGYVLCFQQQA